MAGEEDGERGQVREDLVFADVGVLRPVRVRASDAGVAVAAPVGGPAIGPRRFQPVTFEEYRAAQAITEVACVQNAYNLADRSDQALLDACAADGVAYVPFFPLGSAFHPDKPVLTAPAVVATANRLGATTAQVALAWLLQRSPNLLLIRGTSSLTHLRENLAAAELELDARAIDAIA